MHYFELILFIIMSYDEKFNLKDKAFLLPSESSVEEQQ
jgi:hypothetical protein